MPDHNCTAHNHHDHDHHNHGTGCGHHHAPSHFGQAFAIGITLNVVFVAVEVFYGLQGNSLALLADAGHNASDVLGLVMAWVAYVLAKRLPCERYTYGLQNAAILAALANGVLLMLATGGIMWEAVQRFTADNNPAAKTMLIVAAIGVVINGVTAMLFHAGSKHDLNAKGAYLHMAADAAVSLGVVVSGFIIMRTGWGWVDPLVSLMIAAVIIIGTWSLLREALAMSLGAVPYQINPTDVRGFLASQSGVNSVHDLHIWPVGTKEIALTAHIMMQNGHPGDAFLYTLADALKQRFGITHPTIQLELGDTKAQCALAPEDVL